MRELFLRNWTFMRLFRIALGGIVVAQGIYSQEWIFVILGSIFTIIAFLNLGCGASSSCQYRR